MRHSSVAFLVLSLSYLAFAQQPVAFTGAKIIPIAGPEIDAGVLVISQSKILAVGPAATTKIPDGATKIDVTGKIIMPGLVDSHSHIGEPEGGDTSAPIQPDVRVLD